MMRNIFLLFNLIVALTIISCSKQNEETGLECDKLQSREEAETLVENIRNNKFNSSSSIKDNLIGQWNLIGLVPGWVGFEPGKECLQLNIDEDFIVLTDLNSGTESTTPYEVIPFEVNNYEGFYLSTNEDVWNNRIGMDLFSENHMSGTGRVEDGDIYIYEKIE